MTIQDIRDTLAAEEAVGLARIATLQTQLQTINGQISTYVEARNVRQDEIAAIKAIIEDMHKLNESLDEFESN